MIVMLTGIFSLHIRAQSVSTGLDLVSTYVWRGTKLSGASIQPLLQFTKGGFSIGSWGSAGFDGFLDVGFIGAFRMSASNRVGVKIRGNHRYSTSVR